MSGRGTVRCPCPDRRPDGRSPRGPTGGRPPYRSPTADVFVSPKPSRIPEACGGIDDAPSRSAKPPGGSGSRSPMTAAAVRPSTRVRVSVAFPTGGGARRNALGVESGRNRDADQRGVLRTRRSGERRRRDGASDQHQLGAARRCGRPRSSTSHLLRLSRCGTGKSVGTFVPPRRLRASVVGGRRRERRRRRRDGADRCTDVHRGRLLMVPASDHCRRPRSQRPLRRPSRGGTVR